MPEEGIPEEGSLKEEVGGKEGISELKQNTGRGYVEEGTDSGADD